MEPAKVLPTFPVTEADVPGSPYPADCCQGCGKALLSDERAIYRRLISRAASRFLCIDCLAQRFGCTRKVIEEKIAYYKSIGCTLF